MRLAEACQAAEVGKQHFWAGEGRGGKGTAGHRKGGQGRTGEGRE